MAEMKKPPTKPLIVALSDGIRKKTSQAKLETLDRACLDRSVTDTQFRHLYALLEKFHSTDSGQCHPSDAKLGKAAGGKCARTAGTQTRSLQENGYLTKTPSRGASNYTFPGVRAPVAKSAEGRQHLSDLNSGRSVTSRHKVGKVTTEGRQQGCRAEPLPQPLPEPLPKSEASPSPLNEASASFKKNGLQGEQRRRPAVHEVLFEKPKRWKAGDPDGEFTEEEIEALKEWLR